MERRIFLKSMESGKQNGCQTSKHPSKIILAHTALLTLFVMILFDNLAVSSGTTLPGELTTGGDTGPLGNAVSSGDGGGNNDFVSKRNWKSLQGAWGKRSLGDGISAELNDADDDVYFIDRQVPLPFSIADNSKPILKYSLVYLKNAGGFLDHLMNNDDIMLDTHSNDGSLKTQYDMDMEGIDGVDNAISNEKRAWKSMNVAWGKRRNAPQWNKFRGAWGKREPGWNNLKGMWGKRGSNDWQKLHGSWGKRSSEKSSESN